MSFILYFYKPTELYFMFKQTRDFNANILVKKFK